MNAITNYDRRRPFGKIWDGLISIFTAILLLIGSPAALADDDVVLTEMVVFGDSYSDTGNFYFLTGFAIPQSPPYFDGRFSSGPLWHEVVAGELGMTAAKPSLIGGTNFAWGGAQTGEGLAVIGVPNLGLQIDLFLAESSPRSDQLFIIAGGGNDVIQPVPPTPPEQIVGNIVAHVTELATAGGRYFAVTNLPTIPDLPFAASLDDETLAELARITARTNRLLLPSLRKLENELKHKGMDVEIAHINWNRSMRFLLKFPGLIDVEDTTGTAMTPPDCPPCIGELAPDPNIFFWFDALHPTGPVHEGLSYFALHDIRRQLFNDD